MLDREFDAFARHPDVRFLPDELRDEIDEINAFVYENVNDGVYRTGFARTQAAYERAFGKLFDALDELDARLATRRYLVGRQRSPRPTGGCSRRSCASTPVYVGHFKCNLRRIDRLPAAVRLPARAVPVPRHRRRPSTWITSSGTTTARIRTLNPTRIVPVGPALDLTAPHGRDHLS